MEDQDELTVWEDKIGNFMQLVKLKNLVSVANQPIQNFKSEEIKRIAESEYTFAPVINKVSEQLVLRKKQGAHSSAQELYNKNTIRGKKVQDMIEKKDKQFEQNLTFTPKINRNKARGSGYYPNSQEYEQIKEDMQYRNDIRQKVLEEVKKRKEAQELAECTFKPKINGLSGKALAESSKPSNFEKEIGRMRFAYYERMEQKQKADKVPVGEKYEYMRALPIDPPKCATNYIIRCEEPFLYLDVNTGTGRSGRIGLKPDDDPYEKAREFAVAFQVNEEMEAGLAALLAEQLEIYWEENGVSRELTRHDAGTKHDVN